MEFEEQEEQDEEMEIPEDLPLPPQQQQEQEQQQQPYGQPPTANASPASSRKPSSSASVRYRECQKNHALGIGGSAVDGCGEFMPAGEEGTLDALRCAACNCHRNFHRKETTDTSSPGAILYPPPHHHYHHYGPGPYQQFSPYYRAAAAGAAASPSGYLQLTAGPSMQRHLALPAAAGGATSSREDAEDYVSNNPGSSGGSGSAKKRFRTKFTQEQKDRMLEFAERLGWRIQRHDDAAVEQFCAENGIRRHVLKVWMHNNKHTLGKKP